MSALPNYLSSALPIPPPYRAPFCKVNLSFFHHLLKITNYAQLKCYALILVETVGDTEASKPGPNRYWSEIDKDTFVKATGVTGEWVNAALDDLERYQWINRRERTKGRIEYKIDDRFIQEIEGAGKKNIRGRCTDCKTVGSFDSRYVQLPHAALRKLGGCVGPAAFKVVMTVFMHTAQWNEHYWTVNPKELCSQDFERLADLDDRQISNGVAEALELGLIGQQLRKGKPSIFWAIPDSLVNLERRPMRKVSPPERGVKQEAKTKVEVIVKTPIKSAESTATESRSYFYGRCGACGHFVDVEPVSEEELRAAEPEKHPRAGPERETGRSNPQKKSKFWQEMERRRREAIEDAEGVA